MKIFDDLDIEFIRKRKGYIGCAFAFDEAGNCLNTCGVLFPKLCSEKTNETCPCNSGLKEIDDRTYRARKRYVKNRFWNMIEKHHPRGKNYEK